MEGLMKEGINRGIFHSHTKDIKRADFGDPIQGLAPLYLTKMDLAKKSVAEALQARQAEMEEQLARTEMEL